MSLTWLKAGIAALLMSASAVAMGAADVAPPGMELTPPRLSLLDGKVSFWRPGAEDWAPAQINTPLAAGDALYTGERASLEIQVGPRAFVRAREGTQLGLANFDADFMQFNVTEGEVALDLRSLPAGHTVELDTPNAIFTIEHPGYYRAAVRGDVTRFTTRRGGRAMITVAGRPVQTISPSEEVIVRGTSAPTVEAYVAPPLDAWDRWNYARTDHEIEALSGRYVPTGVYGVGALDDWGTWRVVPVYGTVWVPASVAVGWVPYSTGSWIWDPYYGWTWVDDAPWGWRRFITGAGFSSAAIGPRAPSVIVRPVYAPALVAFFGVGLSVSVRIGIGGPAISWVALGWGEPLRPWWGAPGFIGAPWWGGWGGPRMVNNVVIQRTTIVNVNTIVYQHTKTPRAVLAVGEKQFGSGPIRGTQFSPADPREIAHIRDAHPVRPGPASLVPARGSAIRPPAAVASRQVLATRAPRQAPLPWPQAPAVKPQVATPAPRIVPAPTRPEAGAALPRPSFGEKGTERPRPPPAPRFKETPRVPPAASERTPPRSAPPAPARPAETRPAPRAPAARTLPGRPANELSPRQAQRTSQPAPKGQPGGQR
jgi:hypothetical protein